MIQIEFDYNQHYTKIQANLKDKFKDVIDKYIQKSLLDPSSLYFLANGKQINPEETVEQQMSDMNKQNQNFKVLVQLIEDGNTKTQVFDKSKDIICPKCREPCRIKVEDFHLKLFGCINNHTIKNIKFSDFPNTQRINISNIICEKCKIKNKGNSPNHEFYKCLTCNINLCLLCKTNHNQNHNIIKYDHKNYICQKHNEHLIKFCTQCNKNICYSCDEEHENHKTIFLGDLKPNMEEANKQLSEMKKEIDLFNKDIKDIIDRLNKLIETMNIYYEINSDILNRYEKQNRNYQILQNIKDININNKICETLKNINGTINIKDKLQSIIEFYNNINSNSSDIKSVNPDVSNEIKNKEELINSNISSSDKKNQLTIIYNIDKNNDSIKLFGKYFVEDNKDNCYLLIDGNQTELCENFKLKSNHKNKNQFEIKLIEKNKIISISSMFGDCNSLISLPDLSKWNTENVSDISYMFNYCTSLKSLPDISNWDTKSVIYMNCLFQNCSSLESLPDISKWNTQNVQNINCMFNDCNSLKSLPDISKWDTKNVRSMRSVFVGCELLKSLPDISKWDLQNVTDINAMFQSCYSLESLPDISKWNVKNVTDISYMFSGCESLKSLPDISKWDIKNVIDMSSMFNNCSSLKSFPDISKWSLKKEIKKESMFSGCDKNIIPKGFKDF